MNVPLQSALGINAARCYWQTVKRSTEIVRTLPWVNVLANAVALLANR